jgi:hypothetical protein
VPGSTRNRPRRSELATPASNEHMCQVAAKAGADLVFLDLEDACAPAVKERARSTAVAALTELDWGDSLRAIRINGLDTPWCYGDIIEVVTGARDALDIIIIPKVLSAREVWWVEVLLDQLETALELTRPIALEALVEEAEGLLNAQEIAKASPRLEAIIFGAGDLSASLRARVDGNFQPVEEYPATIGTRSGCRCLRQHGQPESPRSTHPIPDIKTSRDIGGRPPMLGCSASTASGPFTPARCLSPTPSSLPQRRKSPRREPSSTTTDVPRKWAWAQWDAMASSSTQHSCATPPMCYDAFPKTSSARDGMTKNGCDSGSAG